MDILIGGDGVSLNKGKLSLTGSRGASLAQRLSIRIQTHIDSWFLDINLGIDYFNKVFEKTIPKSTIDAMFQAEIYKDVRVLKIIGFSSRLNRNRYEMEFKVQARDGFISDVVALTATSGNITIKVGA